MFINKKSDYRKNYNKKKKKQTCVSDLAATQADPCFTASIPYSICFIRPWGDQTVTSIFLKKTKKEANVIK